MSAPSTVSAPPPAAWPSANAVSVLCALAVRKRDEVTAPSSITARTSSMPSPRPRLLLTIMPPIAPTPMVTPKPCACTVFSASARTSMSLVVEIVRRRAGADLHVAHAHARGLADVAVDPSLGGAADIHHRDRCTEREA